MPTIKRLFARHEPVKVHDPYYDTPRWRATRKAIFDESPLCDYCSEKGIARQAKTLDHVLNRKMWPELEWEGTNLKRACVKCDNTKRQIEGKYREKTKLVEKLKEAGFIKA